MVWCSCIWYVVLYYQFNLHTPMSGQEAKQRKTSNFLPSLPPQNMQPCLWAVPVV